MVVLATLEIYRARGIRFVFNDYYYFYEGCYTKEGYGTISILENSTDGLTVLEIREENTDRRVQFILNDCDVDLSSGTEDHSFIGEITETNFEDPHNKIKVKLYSKNEPSLVSNSVRHVLGICHSFFELYEISILKEEHGHYVKCIILAFYDKVLLLPFETENLVVVYLFEEVTETEDSCGNLVLHLQFLDWEWIELEGSENSNSNSNTVTTTATIKCCDLDKQSALKHYLTRLLGKDENFEFGILSDDKGSCINMDSIEGHMMRENKAEHVYYNEDTSTLCSCTRSNNTFIHKPMGSNFKGLMSSLGYSDVSNHHSDTSSCRSDEPHNPELPDVSYLHEWFWPHVTYQQAEQLLDDRHENMAVIRMSQSKPGHFALTAAYGKKGDKAFKHFHIKTLKSGMYRFGTKEDTFTSYLDIMRYFVEINHYKYFPYFAKRDNKWRASVHGLFLGPADNDVKSRTGSFSSNSDAPKKPPRREKPRRTKSKGKLPKSKSMVTLRQPMLLTIEDKEF